MYDYYACGYWHPKLKLFMIMSAAKFSTVSNKRLWNILFLWKKIAIPTVLSCVRVRLIWFDSYMKSAYLQSLHWPKSMFSNYLITEIDATN